MASADLTSDKSFATLEVDSTQRTYTRGERVPDKLLRVENVGAAAVVIAPIGHTITMDPASPTQADNERLIPVGASLYLTRGTAGFTYKAGSTASLLAIEDATA